MRETTCKNGHIFDCDMYLECPYCNGNNRTIQFDSELYPDNKDITRMEEPETDITRMEEPDDTTWMEDSDPAYAENSDTIQHVGKYREEGSTESTVGINRLHEIQATEPVAGWLVCINGPEKGKDYRIRCQMNTVGRSEIMDISINDPTVLPDKNARIAYDPRHNEFHLLPADNCNNIYLNDQAVYVPTKLKARDQIEFGESKMIFIPFCDEHFHWDKDDRSRNNK